MEVLDDGLLAAAMTNFFSTLEADSGSAAYSFQMDDEDFSFDLSDFFFLNDNALPPAPPEFSVAAPDAMARSFEQSLAPPTIVVENNTRDELPPLPRMEEGCRIAFRIKTDEEILDDGFKWRKYGKKSVKNSPNPRNYYRCSTEGCSVKKRVERDHEDPSYVITTYEGIHNHSSPGVVYYATQDSVSGRFLFSGSHVHGPGPGSSATGSSTSNLT